MAGGVENRIPSNEPQQPPSPDTAEIERIELRNERAFGLLPTANKIMLETKSYNDLLDTEDFYQLDEKAKSDIQAKGHLSIYKEAFYSLTKEKQDECINGTYAYMFNFLPENTQSELETGSYESIDEFVENALTLLNSEGERKIRSYGLEFRNEFAYKQYDDTAKKLLEARSLGSAFLQHIDPERAQELEDARITDRNKEAFNISGGITRLRLDDESYKLKS